MVNNDEEDLEFDKNLNNLRNLVEKESKEVMTFKFLKRILINTIHKFKGSKLVGIFHKFDRILTTKEGDIGSSKLANE